MCTRTRTKHTHTHNRPWRTSPATLPSVAPTQQCPRPQHITQPSTWPAPTCTACTPQPAPHQRCTHQLVTRPTCTPPLQNTLRSCTHRVVRKYKKSLLGVAWGCMGLRCSHQWRFSVFRRRVRFVFRLSFWIGRKIKTCKPSWPPAAARALGMVWFGMV